MEEKKMTILFAAIIICAILVLAAVIISGHQMGIGRRRSCHHKIPLGKLKGLLK